MTYARPCPEGVDLTRALSSGAEPDVQTHLDACAKCRRERDVLDRVRALARDLPDSPLPAAAAVRVRAVLLDTGSAPPTSRRFRRWWLALPALALPALALAGAGVFRAHDESPPSARPQAAPGAQGARRARAVGIPPAESESRPAPEVPAPAAPESAPAAAPESSPAAAPAAPRPARTTAQRRIALADPATPPAARVPPAPDARAAVFVRESERLFEAGWSAFRAHDYGTAARAFERITLLHAGDPLAEDAAFWLAMAMARAGNRERAAAALASFVERFPGSSRVGEASLKLGWLLVDTGQAARAAARFRAALTDPSPEVRASAQAGLDAAEPAAGTVHTPAP